MLQNRPSIGLVEIKRARFGAYELTLPVFPSRQPGPLVRHLQSALREHGDRLAEQIDRLGAKQKRTMKSPGNA